MVGDEGGRRRVAAAGRCRSRRGRARWKRWWRSARDRLLEVGAGHVDREQRQVVVGVDLDVQLGPLGQLEARPAARPGCRAARRARGSGRRSRGGARGRRRGARGRRSAWCRRAPPTGAAAARPRRRRWRPRRGSSRAGSRSRGRPARCWPAGCRGGRRSPRCTSRPARAPGPVHQEALGAGEEVLAAGRRQRHRLPRVGDRVVRRGQAHPLVAEQFALGRLGHAGDVAAVGEPGRDLHRVVDPADVVGLPVSCFYRLGQDATLSGPRNLKIEPESGLTSHRLAHGVYIRLCARLAQLGEHLICNQEVAGSIPAAGFALRARRLRCPAAAPSRRRTPRR